MVRLTDNASAPALQNALLRGWAWWRGELTATFAPLARLLRPARATGTVVHLARQNADEAQSEKGYAATLQPESWQALARALSAASRRARPLVLDLGEDLVLRRRATYPAGALARLDDIISLDVEKSTPFTRQSAVWTWHVTQKRGAEIEVETVILRRDLVLSILSLARGSGLDVAEIVAGAGRGRQALTLMKLDTPLDRARRRWRRVNLGLFAVVVLMAAANAGLSHWQRESALDTVRERFETAKDRAVRLRRAQSQAVAEYDASVALLRRKFDTPSVNAVWNALSRSLPDTVFLTAFEFSGDVGRISGFATSAAPLIERLEALDELSAVTFASPVMINPDDRLERFDITFDLEAVFPARDETAGRTSE